ncbi:MAG: chromosomal replication initiator protein DnaA, partial [Oscillospiraceae bacterium]|nr:chromosomal replication initiator protein DnaA [Oscillospiraceae bacterium]
AILQNKAIEYGVKVPDDVLGYIADNVRSNIRELEGVLKSVISNAQVKEIPLTVDYVKEILGKITVTDRVKVTPKKIIEKTAFYYNITENDIMGKIKTKEIAVPRQVAMYLCRKMLSMSDTAIGKEFGKDRSTVSSNIDKIEELLRTGSSVESEINYIIKDIDSR